MNPGLAAGWSHVLLLRLLGDLCVEDGSAWDVLRSEPLMGVSFVTLLWCTALPSAVAFAVAAAAHVLKKMLVMPEGLDNNGTYLLLVMINFLYGSADQLLLSGSATTSGTTSVAEPDGVLSPIDEAVAAARALTLALYFFAAFAKLNTGFMLHTNFSAATMGLVQLLKLAPDGAWPSRPSPRAQQMTRGAETSFLHHFYAKTRTFSKTGSEQTWEKLRNKRRFCQLQGFCSRTSWLC